MDFERANLLLQVADEAVKYPQLRSLTIAALEELNKMANSQAKPEPEVSPRVEPAPLKRKVV